MFKTNFYIGSTKNFKKRMDKHKSNCNNPNSPHHNLKVYKFIRENGGWSDWSKIIIATVDVADKIEQCKIEQVYIDHLEPGLNCSRSFQTPEQLKEQIKEYRIKNREQLKERQKDYYNKNREKIKEKRIKKRELQIIERQKEYYNKIKKNMIKNEKTNQTNLINKYIK